MNIPFHDAISRLAQAGKTVGVQLVRVTALQQNNRYTARPIEFDAQGETQFVGEEMLAVTNLAEPANSPGQLPKNTDAVAIDIEGRWIIFVRRQTSSAFPARITGSSGGSSYTALEQVATGSGGFVDKSGAETITVYNLAEGSLGPGAAVETDTIVLVSMFMTNGMPPVAQYVFDHPVYAKYLD